MIRKRLTLFVAILFVLTAMAGTAGASSMPMNVAPGYENILRMATSPDPDTNDPQKTTEFFCVNFMIFDRLIEAVTTDPSQTELVSGLAKSWDVFGDALVVPRMCWKMV